MVKTYLFVKQGLHGLGQAPACCCMTDADMTHATLYLNMDKMNEAICGLSVNGRLVSREKSPQGEESCYSSSAWCVMYSGE